MLYTFMQMQLPLAEDLLGTIENFVVAIGDVLNSNGSENLDNQDDITITRKNISV